MATDLNKDQQNAFVLLCACFVLLDRNFSNDEAEFIDRLLDAEDIDVKLFHKAIKDLSGKDVRKIAKTQILALQHLSRSQQEILLDTLFELSLSDGFLHVDEKFLLEDINKHWGFQVIFGKGQLSWTDEQLEIILADEKSKIAVNATPGAGKTALACAKISHLIDEGIPASQIWLLSFTRTAVQELRNRIASFASEDEDVIGVVIATIDSRAWKLRFGMTDERGENLFQSYDLSISKALELIKKNPEDYMQAFESVSHLIIDEAQDITGVRLQLIEQIVRMLPFSCGVTVFGDEAQAIYGFTSEAEFISEGQNYLRVLKERHSDSFDFLQVNSMHRTENLALRKLIDELRLNIQVESPAQVISVKEAAKKIKDVAGNLETTFNANELEGMDDTLVLFRRRSDVLQAAHFANQVDLKYRIRMGGLPVVCKPWIGQILFGTDIKRISQDEFETIWQSKGDEILACGDTAFSAFYHLMKVANLDGKILIKKLRNLASRSVPPIELCIPDLGTEGPILGTIHASKGREAENVRLFINAGTKPNSSAEEKAEETRVLFVGASRAKQTLTVGKGFVVGGSSTKKGRSYKQIKNKNKAQVEIGRNGDFDIYSVVHIKNVTNDEAVELQQTLVKLHSSGPKNVKAVLNPKCNWVYDLYAEGSQDIWIGQFNRQLNFDLFDIKKRINPSTKNRITNKICHLKMIGLSTAALPDNLNDHSMAETIVETARDSGFWLVPTIMGYPTLWFK